MDRDLKVIKSAVDAEVNRALATDNVQERISTVKLLGTALTIDPKEAVGNDLYSFRDRKNVVLSGIGRIALGSNDPEIMRTSIESAGKSLEVPDVSFHVETRVHPFAIQLIGTTAIHGNDQNVKQYAFDLLRNYANKPIIEGRVSNYSTVTATHETQALANTVASTLVLPPAPANQQ